MRNLIWTIFKLAVIGFIILGAVTYFMPEEETTHTVTVDSSDALSANTSSQIQEIILGESRKKAELIVYEQDLSATQTISKAMFDWDLFRKSQDVTSYGTAVYTVNLSAIGDDDIAVDENGSIVQVTIPHSTLKSVNVDVTKTEFSDISRKIFGWGDITLTPEQQNLLSQQLLFALEEEANRQEYLERADEQANYAVHSFYSSVLSKQGVTVRICFTEDPS